MLVEVNVVIPTYRRGKALPDLFKALEAQTLPAEQFDVRFVDNGSDDATLALLHRLAQESPLQVKVLSHTSSQGPAGPRNAGWRDGVAPVVAFTDDDCLPEPEWLAGGLRALQADSRVGVLQGHTTYPPDSEFRTWSVHRHITGPTPFFEACNLFFRRAALEQTGGFDETAAFYFEDTAAGWRVLDRGWQQGYEDSAVVSHPVEDRGFVWHLRNGLAEQNLVRVAAAHPGFRQAALWRDWAYHPELVALGLGVLGCGVAALRGRPAPALLLVPYALRIAQLAPTKRPAYLAQRTVVDLVRLGAHLRGSWVNRTLVL